jgi:hypothetical protein
MRVGEPKRFGRRLSRPPDRADGLRAPKPPLPVAEGHGHIHTLSREIPDIPDIVIRHAPEAELKARLDFFHWVRRQIETGQQEGMQPSAIVATCFPWGRRWSWERFGADLAAQVLSGGEFSRSELVRSFHRRPTDEVMPEVCEIETRDPGPH